jgi:pimeloyl-ACP methyl ester carboxylesterase
MAEVSTTPSGTAATACQREDCILVTPRAASRGGAATSCDHTPVMPSAQVEVWPDSGHFVHLAEPDRFAGRLRRFVDECSP